MSSLCSLNGFIKNAPACTESLQTLVNQVQRMTDRTTNLAKKLQAAKVEVDGMEGDVTKLKQQLEECKKLLKRMHSSACVFVDEVDRCLECGDIDRKREFVIKESVRRGRYIKLSTYLTQLLPLFNESQKAYKKFDNLCKLATPACEKGAMSCGAKMKEVRENKRYTRRLGGALRAVGAVVGVGGVTGAAVVAGLFSFGIGTPVVLGIAAGAAGGAAVGGGAGAVGAKIATEKKLKVYKKAEKVFKEISKEFDSVSNNASEIDVTMFQISEQFNALLPDMDCVSSAEDFYSFRRSFDILLHSIKDTRKNVRQCSDKMRSGILKIE